MRTLEDTHVDTRMAPTKHNIWGIVLWTNDSCWRWWGQYMLFVSEELMLFLNYLQQFCFSIAVRYQQVQALVAVEPHFLRASRSIVKTGLETWDFSIDLVIKGHWLVSLWVLHLSIQNGPKLGLNVFLVVCPLIFSPWLIWFYGRKCVIFIEIRPLASAGARPG